MRMRDVVMSLKPGDIHRFVGKVCIIEVMATGYGLFDVYLLAKDTTMFRAGVQDMPFDYAVGYVEGADNLMSHFIK